MKVAQVVEFLLKMGLTPVSNRKIGLNQFHCDNFTNIITIGCQGSDWLNIHFNEAGDYRFMKVTKAR